MNLHNILMALEDLHKQCQRLHERCDMLESRLAQTEKFFSAPKEPGSIATDYASPMRGVGRSGPSNPDVELKMQYEARLAEDAKYRNTD